MSRIIKVLVALLAIAAIAAPVMAEDRLALSGSMQVRGYFVQQDDGTTDDSAAWNDQRMRVAGKLSVAEGVSVNFRFDASESDENSSSDVAWGGSTSAYAPYSHRRADIQFDKAYLQLVKGGYTFAAGEMAFGGFGTGHILDTVGTGVTLSRGPVAIAHVKQYDSNNRLVDTPYDDTSLTAAKFTFKGDGFSVVPMVSYTLAQSTDINRLGVGVFFAADLTPVKLKGELDYFNGENAAAADEKGLQLYVDGSMSASDTVTVGLMGFYAQGQDGGDVQVTYQKMPVFGGWSPQTYGFNSTDFDVDFDMYDISGAGAGVIAGQLYADVKLSDDLTMTAAAMYATVEDDAISDVSGYILNGGLVYNLMANTQLTTSINYSAMDDNGTDVDTIQVISGLYVNF